MGDRSNQGFQPLVLEKLPDNSFPAPRQKPVRFMSVQDNESGNSTHTTAHGFLSTR